MSDLMKAVERESWISSWAATGKGTQRACWHLRGALRSMRQSLYVYEACPSRYASDVIECRMAVDELDSALRCTEMVSASCAVFPMGWKPRR